MTGDEPIRASAHDANEAHAQRICALNDQFRQSFIGGRIMLTPGVRELARDMLPSLLMQIRQFNAFNTKNDPYAEHDFGAFEWDGETVFWKIDYYDSDLIMGSPDPTEPAVTTRVLTIMLAWEY
jgi:hypothetical protein